MLFFGSPAKPTRSYPLTSPAEARGGFPAPKKLPIPMATAPAGRRFAQLGVSLLRGPHKMVFLGAPCKTTKKGGTRVPSKRKTQFAVWGSAGEFLSVRRVFWLPEVKGGVSEGDFKFKLVTVGDSGVPRSPRGRRGAGGGVSGWSQRALVHFWREYLNYTHLRKANQPDMIFWCLLFLVHV